MTQAPTHRTPHKTWDDAYVSWLVTVHDSARLAALRRGDSEATASRALPLLAPFYADHPWAREPMLLHAAAYGAFGRLLRHRAGITPGQLIAALTRERHLSPTSARSRITSVQSMSLRQTHRTLRGVYAMAGNGHTYELDWRATWVMYRNWDIPDPGIRRDTRWRLIEQFEQSI